MSLISRIVSFFEASPVVKKDTNKEAAITTASKLRKKFSFLCRISLRIRRKVVMIISFVPLSTQMTLLQV
jgi:hypothetical protein